jgi:uncharacterized protein (TIGR03118 family)
MKPTPLSSTFRPFATRAITGTCALVAATLLLHGHQASSAEKDTAPATKQTAPAAVKNSYTQTILVANRPEYKPVAFVDEHLVNPWGIALRPPGKGGHIWVSNAQNATTTTYIGDVNGEPLHQDGLKVIGIDGGLISYEDGVPNVTGQVYNAASDIAGQPVEFPVSGPAVNLTSGKPVPAGNTSGSAKFVFVTTDGTINAWRSSTAECMKSAVVVKDFSEKGADRMKDQRFLPAYTGVAMTTDAFRKDEKGEAVADNRLYVTDFQNKRIQVFNNQWKEITAQVPFERPAGLKEEMSPYNIQLIGDKLFVLYAVVDVNGEEPGVDVPNPGAGHMVVYDRNGKLLQQFQDEGKLNSPWGVTQAPASFGVMGGKLLVANFGDGTIAAFEPESGKFIDYLRDAEGKAIAIDGIWGLAFGNGVSLGDANALYFTAGPETEQDGLFGRLNAAR